MGRPRRGRGRRRLVSLTPSDRVSPEVTGVVGLTADPGLGYRGLTDGVHVVLYSVRCHDFGAT